MNRFIIARPSEKASQTVSCFDTLGLNAICWPIIDIKLIDLGSVNKTQDKQLRLSTLVITSTYAIDWLQTQNGLSIFDLSSTENIICVGNSTAEKLQLLLSNNNLIQSSFNLIVANPSNSEGILSCDCLKSIANKQIGIIKGKGGRDILESELRKRKACVTVLDVYQRIVNTQKPKDDNFTIEKTDCLVATSVEIVEAIFNNYDKKRLIELNWIVPSARIKQFTESLGVVKVLLSESASANSLAKTALQLVQTGLVND